MGRGASGGPCQHRWRIRPATHAEPNRPTHMAQVQRLGRQRSPSGSPRRSAHPVGGTKRPDGASIQGGSHRLIQTDLSRPPRPSTPKREDAGAPSIPRSPTPAVWDRVRSRRHGQSTRVISVRLRRMSRTVDRRTILRNEGVSCARVYARPCIIFHYSASALTSQRQLLRNLSCTHRAGSPARSALPAGQPARVAERGWSNSARPGAV